MLHFLLKAEVAEKPETKLVLLPYSRVVKSPGQTASVCVLLALQLTLDVRPWASYSTSLILTVVICKVGQLLDLPVVDPLHLLAKPSFLSFICLFSSHSNLLVLGLLITVSSAPGQVSSSLLLATAVDPRASPEHKDNRCPSVVKSEEGPYLSSGVTELGQREPGAACAALGEACLLPRGVRELRQLESTGILTRSSEFLNPVHLKASTATLLECSEG